MSEFLDCTKNLSKSYEPGSIPSRCEILCSLCGIASSVLRLLDLVDSLFVSKFPMRKQVYSFTEKLLELGMAYKPVEVKGGREGDAIRDMRKQLPALNNSAKVGSVTLSVILMLSRPEHNPMVVVVCHEIS